MSWNRNISIDLPLNLASNLEYVILTTHPDSENILASIKSSDLSSFSYEVLKTAKNVPMNISATVSKSTDSIIGDVIIKLENVKESINNSSSVSIHAADKLLDDALLKSTIIFKDVLYYDGFRYF